MPKTKSFLNPDCDEKYKSYLEFDSILKIKNYICDNFSFPVILKMNRGSSGDCVFKVDDKDGIEEAINNVYEKDYILLAQQYIDIKTEYRAIFFEDELMFVYKKNNENAVFVGNLSPLHFDGAFAEIENNNDVLQRLEKFGKQISNKFHIDYMGLDIAIDDKDDIYLIEANLSPGYNYFLENKEAAPCLEKLYTKMADKIIKDING